MKAKFDNLDFNKTVDVPTSLNNIKKKIDDLDNLDVDKLKTVAVTLKKLDVIVGNPLNKMLEFWSGIPDKFRWNSRRKHLE